MIFVYWKWDFFNPIPVSNLFSIASQSSTFLNNSYFISQLNSRLKLVNSIKRRSTDWCKYLEKWIHWHHKQQQIFDYENKATNEFSKVVQLYYRICINILKWFTNFLTHSCWDRLLDCFLFQAINPADISNSFRTISYFTLKMEKVISKTIFQQVNNSH